jgi:hypothetical protein
VPIPTEVVSFILVSCPLPPAISWREQVDFQWVFKGKKGERAAKNNKPILFNYRKRIYRFQSCSII